MIMVLFTSNAIIIVSQSFSELFKKSFCTQMLELNFLIFKIKKPIKQLLRKITFSMFVSINLNFDFKQK